MTASTTAFTFHPTRSVTTTTRPSLAMLPPSPALSQELISFTKDVVTGSSTTAMGDIMAQFVETKGWKERPSSLLETDNNFMLGPFGCLDSRRTMAYTVFGAIYTGGLQHFIFANLFQHISNGTVRLAINQGVIIPFLYYPLLKYMVPRLRARNKEDRKRLEDVIQFKHMVPRNWSYWIPLQYIQFHFIPKAYQVVYVSLVGLMWKVLLSWFTAGGRTTSTSSAAATAATTTTTTVKTRHNPTKTITLKQKGNARRILPIRAASQKH